MKLILASGSPRRSQILTKHEVPFEVIKADVEEVTRDSAYETVTGNALLKGEEVAGRFPDRWVLAADTVVSYTDQILEKPVDLVDARRMLGVLSGQKHQVFTAAVLINKSKGVCYEWVMTSDVKMKELNPELMDRYFEVCHPLDKAGAYNIEEYGDWLVESVDGSFENVMGLDGESVKEILAKFELI